MRMEAVKAQRKSTKDAVKAQVAREVEETELKRKAAVKEKDQSMRKRKCGKSKLDSVEILKGSQYQHEPGAGSEEVNLWGDGGR